MKRYIKDFVAEDEGVETIEFIGLIAVAAALVIAIAKIGGTMTQTATSKQEELSNALESIDGLVGNS